MNNFKLLFFLIPLHLAAASAQTMTASDGQKLSFVWTEPSSDPAVAVLVLQGSGNVGVDGDVSSPFIGSGYRGQSAKLSQQIAEALAKKGIASLRFAKRGVDNPDQVPNQKFPFLKTDAETALRLLKLKYIGKKIGIVGLSEGALIASLIANEQSVDGLYLLSPPLRPIDDLFGYQFFQWPVELLKSKLVFDRVASIDIGGLSAEHLTDTPQYDVAKMMGIDLNFAALDKNKDHRLSLREEIVPAYSHLYSTVLALLRGPALAGWYQSYRALPAFQMIMGGLQTKALYVYAGVEDPQVKWSWIFEDAHFFNVTPNFRLYPELGHCFAPMDGFLKTVKSSGPIENAVLDQLAADVAAI